MADPLCQDIATWKLLLSSLGPSLAVGLAAVLGFVLLRRQEQVKRQVEHAASIRRLQLDALVELVEAVGRYYNALEFQRFVLDEATDREAAPTVEEEKAHGSAMKEEEKAFHSMMTMMARKGPLLGGGAAKVIEAAHAELISSRSSEESVAIMDRMTKGIAPWVPPLEPVQADEAHHGTPWLGPVAILMLEAAVIAKIFWR